MAHLLRELHPACAFGIAVIVVGGFVALCCLIPARTTRSHEED